MFFLSCDIQTGQILDELPLAISGSLQRALMTVSEGAFDLPVASNLCPANWEKLTEPWRVNIVVVDDEGTIVWAGIPTGRTRQAGDGIVQVKAVTPEAYLDRRMVPPKRFRQADQCSQIARWMVESTLDAGIPYELDCPESGVLRDREYTRDEAGSVLKRLSDLAGVIDGPEFTVDTVWAGANESSIRRVFRTGYPRIGVASSSPHAVFEAPGGLLEVVQEERWGASESATFVVAVGEGEGEAKPFSKPHVATSREWGGCPRLEIWKNFQNVTRQQTLEEYAGKTLARYQNGTTVLSLRQKIGAIPKLGSDWQMGDDVRVWVSTPALSVDKVLRLVGWEIAANMEELTPIVAEMIEKEPDQGMEEEKDTHNG